MTKDLMPLTEYLVDARKRKYALGGYCLWSYAYGMAIAEVSQKFNLPMLYIIGDAEIKFMGGLSNAVAAAKTIAGNVDVPVILHADHFRDYESICRAIDAGFKSVMIDASAYPLEENIERTAKVVEYAHKAGVSVEGELGRIAGNEQHLSLSEEESMQTDPDEAARFVKETGIDILATCIGTVHGAYRFPPKINISRLQKISEKVSIPLVMHGGSGTPEDKMAEAVNYGITKINIATDLVTTVGKAISKVQLQDGFNYTVANLYAPACADLAVYAEHKMRLLAKNIL
ncbi:class II fructose-bisphosphate aldolase [Ruminococcaceae bacterium OttesenSCG-928-I18]|nr:class II fructose-bisphosphate aldolase [Ruminococcaceae bacterium OttesenSCG-928-I18]